MREGAALPQGLASCGHCGRKLHTHYRGKNQAPGYHCSNKNIVDGRGMYCLNVGGVQIDESVVDAFVSAVASMAAHKVAASAGSAGHSEHDAVRGELAAMGVASARAIGAVRLSAGRTTRIDDIDRAAGALVAAWARLTRA